MLLCYGSKCSPKYDGRQSFHFISFCRETHRRPTDMSHTTITFYIHLNWKKKGNLDEKEIFQKGWLYFHENELTSSCSKTSHIHLSQLGCHCMYYFPLKPSLWLHQVTWSERIFHPRSSCFSLPLCFRTPCACWPNKTRQQWCFCAKVCTKIEQTLQGLWEPNLILKTW